MGVSALSSSEPPLLRSRLNGYTRTSTGSNAREFLETIPNPKLEKPFNEPALRAIVQELVSRGPNSIR